MSRNFTSTVALHGLLPQQPQSHELLPCRRGRLPDRVRRGGGRKQDAGDPSPQTLRSTLGAGMAVRGFLPFVRY